MTREEYDKLKKLIENWQHCDEGIQYLDDFDQGKECGKEDCANDLLRFLNVECDGVEEIEE